jgi:hypothetical protein
VLLLFLLVFSMLVIFVDHFISDLEYSAHVLICLRVLRAHCACNASEVRLYIPSCKHSWLTHIASPHLRVAFSSPLTRDSLYPHHALQRENVRFKHIYHIIL